MPRRYFSDGTMLFQGHWAKKHSVIERLEPPFTGHAIARMDRPNLFCKLHGTANLANAILPSRAPVGVVAFNTEFRAVSGVSLTTPASRIQAGISYLEMHFEIDNLHSAFYQRQKNGWHLVRTRMYRELPLILKQSEISTYAIPPVSDGRSRALYQTNSRPS